jgi:hypothetical protein
MLSNTEQCIAMLTNVNAKVPKALLLKQQKQKKIETTNTAKLVFRAAAA